MRIEDLMIFIDVVQYHSMNIASEKHFMTPQNLSKIIHNMEQELEVVLFKRSKRGSELTPVGEKFYWQALKVIQEYNKAIDMLHKKEETPVVPVKVKIICNEGMINYAVLNAYNTLQKEGKNHLLMDLDLVNDFDPNALTEFVKDKDYDIIASGMMEKDLEKFIITCSGYIPIYTIQSEWALLISKRHPLAGKNLIMLDEIKDLKLFVCKGSYGFHQLIPSDVQCQIMVSSLNVIVEQVERSYEFGTLVSKSILDMHKTQKPESELIAIPIEPKVYSSFIIMIREQSNNIKEVREFGARIAQSLSTNKVER